MTRYDVLTVKIVHFFMDISVLKHAHQDMKANHSFVYQTNANLFHIAEPVVRFDA